MNSARNKTLQERAKVIAEGPAKLTPAQRQAQLRAKVRQQTARSLDRIENAAASRLNDRRFQRIHEQCQRIRKRLGIEREVDESGEL